MKQKKIIFIGLILLFLMLASFLAYRAIEKNEKSIKVDPQILSFTQQNKSNTKTTKNNMLEWDKIKQESSFPKEEKKKENLVEYKNMPREIEGYKVIGKLVIPKINLETYILEPTDTGSLNLSVTKLTGPVINEVGNFCITGHNYQKSNMFGKLKKLEIGDKLILIDTYDRQVSYKVYEIQKVKPKDLSCLDQDTKGDREVTLITCTVGAIQRIIVKCIEIYD